MYAHENGPPQVEYQLPCITEETWHTFTRMRPKEFNATLASELTRNHLLPQIRDGLVTLVLRSLITEEGKPSMAETYGQARGACTDGANSALVLLVTQLEKEGKGQDCLPMLDPKILFGYKATQIEESALAPKGVSPTALLCDRYKNTNPKLVQAADLLRQKYRSSVKNRRALVAHRGMLHMAHLIEMQGNADVLASLVGDMSWDTRE